ncbi:hypothetical protein PG999_008671 [Apiospora kogelbergensis]|uniref:Uncharacterized protein n=1 Tax=Apiospora kogelbergensis TaxID=1337665 RepID=A0AAW0QH11_9PEZI
MAPKVSTKDRRSKQKVAVDVVDKGAPLSEVTSVSSRSQQQMELTSLKRIIKEDRADKARTIIAVVHSSQVPELERKLQGSKLKFWRGKTTVKITTPKSLQATIDTVQADKSAPRHLTLLVGQDLATLEFKVAAAMKSLSIFRHEDPGLGPPAGTLLVSGASTYAKTRLDQWQAKQHQNHAVYLGRGVGIRIESEVLNDPIASRELQVGGGQQMEQSMPRKLVPAGGGWGDSYTLSLSNSDKNEVYELFNSLHYGQEEDNLCYGPNGETMQMQRPPQPWWEKWQGPIGHIIGILTGAKNAHSMRATAGGMFVEYHFGAAALSIGAAGLPQAITLAAGPAVMLGVGAAAAVYFVPWEAVFKWLWGVVKKMFQSFLAVWERLMRWVASKLSGSSSEGKNKDGRPMPPNLFG